jgi:hypothetical protein
MCFISFALLLTAIAAGMFLLAKTNKDGLGNFYRFVSWFIIVSGFLGILLCGMMCLFRMCCGGFHNREHDKMMMFHNGMNMNFEDEMENGDNKRIIIKKTGGEEMECEGNCKKDGGCCKEGGEDKKVEIKKDTIIIKR